MSFKHIKFEESFVMRSLEKLCKEKGLIKNESVKKEASVKLDLTASSNLMENILKLCSGLRLYGFDKQANELELNFLKYKKANTLYETSKETGDDLINAAHPNGSHKVDVLGDDLAVVETILDRHLKMLKVLDKKPTGKLVSSNIINSVKKALAEDNEYKEFISIISDFSKFIGYISDNFNLVQRKVDKSTLLRSLIPHRLITDEAKIIRIKDEIQNIVRSKAFTSRTISEIVEMMNKIIVLLKDVKITQESNLTLEQKLGLIKKMESFIIQLNNLSVKVQSKNENLYLNKPDDVKKVDNTKVVVTPAANTTQDAAKLLIKKFKDSMNLIGLYKARVIAKELPNSANLIQWLDVDAMSYFDKYSKELEASEYKSDPDVIASYTKKLNDGNSKLEAFRQKWL